MKTIKQRFSKGDNWLLLDSTYNDLLIIYASSNRGKRNYRIKVIDDLLKKIWGTDLKSFRRFYAKYVANSSFL